MRRAALIALILWLPATVSSGSDTPAEPVYGPAEREHWAFQPVRVVAPPSVQNSNWCRTPIDRFILARLEEQRLAPQPDASRTTLLRRVTFDLTGLPPTSDEIGAFLGDSRPDAYEVVVDRLLASPAYGERWAQHWLDLARFAETDGFEHDKVRPQAWRYRDWVIDAWNADLPYDQFITRQLAADEVLPDDKTALLATGFLLCGPDMPDINLQEERRHTFLNAMTANVSDVMLALQFGCAECHDHIVDPISQFDFYRLRAFFEPIDLFRDQPAREDGDDREGTPAGLRVTRTANQPVASHLWIRGDFRRPGPSLSADFPQVLELSDSPARDELRSAEGRRAALARWLTSSEHPLTSRVIVNRLWQHLFGQGLVRSSSDFGLLGDSPSHPELLDWLAGELIRQDWSLKALQRQMVTSAVYRTMSRPHLAGGASEAVDANWERLTAIDPDNRLLGRMRRRRLEGEAIRDAMLLVSGQLQRRMHGPGVRPPLPPDVVSTLLKNQWPVTDDASEHGRRSIYLFVRRNLKYPLFDVFDRPDMNLSSPVRSQTTIAPQALHLLNSEFAITCAAGLAAQLSGGATTSERIVQAYHMTLGRGPSAEELAAAEAFLAAGDADAWNDLCLALINLNEFVYVD